MNVMALRAYTENKHPITKNSFPKEIPDYSRVLVLDTETTDDEFQNLRFGSYTISEQEAFEEMGIFYNPNCLKKGELETLRAYCDKNIYKLCTTEEFLKKVFFPEVHIKKTLCIGFNLPFDLSRLAIKYGYGRGDKKDNFVLTLMKIKSYPKIRIKHIDSKRQMISFGDAFFGKNNIYKFKGNFIDLRTLSFALTNESMGLEKACIRFDTIPKKSQAEHGKKLTYRYIEYNVNDVLATHSLYQKLLEESKKYGLTAPLTHVYSPASIGKDALRRMGISIPQLDSVTKGRIMTAYYGGRSEVKVRKQPMKIVLLDFLSMYPTVCVLQNLWQFITAKEIKQEECTEEAKQLLEKVQLEHLKDPDFYKKLPVLVQVQPDNDILPVRAKYGNKEAYNIGINPLTSDTPVWYALADVIASKLLSGKLPKVLKAIRFSPAGKQELNTIEIAGMKINPTEQDFFKKLVEAKENAKGTDAEKIIKTIVNATSYGIFIEMHVSNRQAEMDVYGNENFSYFSQKEESVGEFFNPLLAVLITSASRLMLAIVESLLDRKGMVHAFCDTDSMAVPVEAYKEIQEFFTELSPYSFKKPLFKLEKENFDKNGKLKDLWFFGISAKRYVLYNLERGKIVIRKSSMHGLGHLKNPFTIQNKDSEKWQEMIWRDILNMHMGKLSEDAFREKYSDSYAISQLTISSPRLMRPFEKWNKGKPLSRRIKPFNFMLVGFGNKKGVKPICPFTKHSQEAVHKPFVDFETGETLEGEEYWKSLADDLINYYNHPEAKLEGDIGTLKRRQMQIDAYTYIGKESNDIDETGILLTPYYNKFQSLAMRLNKLQCITAKEAKCVGINRNTLHYLKLRAMSGNLRTSKKIQQKLKKLGVM